MKTREGAAYFRRPFSVGMNRIQQGGTSHELTTHREIGFIGTVHAEQLLGEDVALGATMDVLRSRCGRKEPLADQALPASLLSGVATVEGLRIIECLHL